MIDLDRQGVAVVDTGFKRPGFDASHVIVEDGRAAFVDTGTTHSVPRLLAALEALGLTPGAVDYVLVTHVHLDHAGGAGALMRELPQAVLVAHPRGAPHLIDPGKLIRGAQAVYGEAQFRQDYGDIVPVPAERVVEAPDGFELSLNGRGLQCLDTPGHARHHYTIWDPASRSLFPGDTFGLSYRELDTDQGPFIFPTTSPVHFDPEAMHTSIDRLMALSPERAYLTHFGPVAHPQRLAPVLHRRIDACVEIALAVAERGEDRHQALVAGLRQWLLEELVAHGCRLSQRQQEALLATDIELNAQGLAVWLDRGGPRS